MKQFVKHLVECQCILPQYKTRAEPVFHKFVVFSEIDNYGNVVPKYAQCNHCSVIHRVHNIAQSEILFGNDESVSIVSIDDIKPSLPQNVITILETYNCDIATWEQVLFIIENKLWEQNVVLTTEAVNDKIQGKLLKFTGPNLVKIEQYSWSNMFP